MRKISDQNHDIQSSPKQLMMRVTWTWKTQIEPAPFIAGVGAENEKVMGGVLKTGSGTDKGPVQAYPYLNKLHTYSRFSFFIFLWQWGILVVGCCLLVVGVVAWWFEF